MKISGLANPLDDLMADGCACINNGRRPIEHDRSRRRRPSGRALDVEAGRAGVRLPVARTAAASIRNVQAGRIHTLTASGSSRRLRRLVRMQGIAKVRYGRGRASGAPDGFARRRDDDHGASAIAAGRLKPLHASAEGGVRIAGSCAARVRPKRERQRSRS
ncbi:hypothetical protein NPA31_015850 [Aurantimonas sp. MSK8Z-1]|uniref:hypothetical protein n=1 Tax=Mangrovibrevibacter kandeliae TaxID=2968473 RepID=UPI002119980E|nr:hypothetical protein [Aurantimonas sp. MSK8Z-1]MCW4116436.1 hypothetical protein [Aurantimonas sp. MSK8Z-1]